jgi:methylated-DNA-protein-cysteine methyltransferase related protein
VNEEVVERVLTAVEVIPFGRVASYGDIGELVGTGPRHVGSIMRVYGSGVPWWRVTNSYGDFPATMRDDVRPHWADEGIAWKPNGFGCRINDYRADLPALAADFEARWHPILEDRPANDTQP